MDSYLRFQTQLRCEKTGRPLGVFVAAGRVENSPGLPDTTRALLGNVLTWFNQNLVVPALEQRRWRCVFWFRSGSISFVRRIWDLVAILNEEGVYVRKLWTTAPGMIVYSDEYQVGAVPGKRPIR